MIKSCYIHIPFCKKICSYCDFCKMVYNPSFVKPYLQALEEEIKDIYQQEELESIYIGGGTPSCLSEEELETLFLLIDKFQKKKKIEFTIEGNFESTTKEKLELYKKHGVNRLSFGVETTNPSLLTFLNREEKKEEIKEVIKNARELGFHNINIDLIYAIPEESINDLEKDLKFVFSLGVEHISTYSLIIEDNTMLKIKNKKNIEEDLDAQMYQYICKEMKKNHYNHYEISNFSKLGYESQHNTTYWNNEEYYGFGLGSSSYIGNKRIENTRSLTEYNKNNRIKNIEVLSEEDKIEYEIICNLRKKEGISLTEFQRKYQKELREIFHYEDLVKKGLLEEIENHLLIPEDKFYISNSILVQLLGRKEYE